MKVTKLLLCVILASFGTSFGFAKSKSEVRDITGLPFKGDSRGGS